MAPTAAPAGARGDSLAARLALVLLPAALFCAAVELGFRLVPPAPRDAVLERFVVPDARLLWRLRPAARGPLATNELGLRDTAYRADADAKILVLGDSVAWGDGIDEIARTFPYLLERRLATAAPGRTVEVVNAGVPGYTTDQEAAYLEHEGLALGPDLIVVQHCLNDVVTRPPWLTRWRGREALRAAYGFFLRHSRAFAAAARVMQRWAAAQETRLVSELVEPRWSRDVERGWARMLDGLDRIRALAGARAVPVLLLLAPYRSQLDDPAGRRHPQDRLVAYAAAHGLAHVDVLRELAALPRDVGRRSFHDESHFSHLGHDLVADMLAGPVAEALGLDAPRLGPPAAARARWLARARAYALADAARAAGIRGALGRAAALLDEAERLAPDVGLVFQLQSNVRHLAGDRDGAVRALRRGLALEPDNALFRANLERVGAEPSQRPAR